jgi:hypothetical protein
MKKSILSWSRHKPRYKFVDIYNVSARKNEKKVVEVLSNPIIYDSQLRLKVYDIIIAETWIKSTLSDFIFCSPNQ